MNPSFHLLKNKMTESIDIELQEFPPREEAEEEEEVGETSFWDDENDEEMDGPVWDHSFDYHTIPANVEEETDENQIKVIRNVLHKVFDFMTDPRYEGFEDLYDKLQVKQGASGSSLTNTTATQRTPPDPQLALLLLPRIRGTSSNASN